MLDSEPVFRDRMKAIGVSDAFQLALIAAGITTLARLAFSSASMPGSGDDSAFVGFLIGVFALSTQADIPAGQLACLRRLWYEAHAVSLSDIRARTETTEDSPARRLPIPERASRLASQQIRLAGVLIEGPLEPSHGLIDYVFGLKEAETLRYVDPAKCTSRAMELVGVKKQSGIKVNAQGQVVIEDKPSVLTTDISCEFRCRQALQRRSLAFDQADLLGYHILESYHDFLFSLLTMEVPSHCGSINLAQILNADRIAFQRMAEYTRSGISMRSNGTFPLQEALAVARAHPIFTTSLAPVPKSTARKTSPTITRPNKGKGKGKGAGSVKGVPRDLVGYWTRNKQGQARCYDFNLPKGCSEKCDQGKCRKGLHQCVGCGSSDHGLQSCPKKSKKPRTEPSSATQAA